MALLKGTLLRGSISPRVSLILTPTNLEDHFGGAYSLEGGMEEAQLDLECMFVLVVQRLEEQTKPATEVADINVGVLCYDMLKEVVVVQLQIAVPIT